MNWKDKLAETGVFPHKFGLSLDFQHKRCFVGLAELLKDAPINYLDVRALRNLEVLPSRGCFYSIQRVAFHNETLHLGPNDQRRLLQFLPLLSSKLSAKIEYEEIDKFVDFTEKVWNLNQIKGLEIETKSWTVQNFGLMPKIIRLEGNTNLSLCENLISHISLHHSHLQSVHLDLDFLSSTHISALSYAWPEHLALETFHLFLSPQRQIGHRTLIKILESLESSQETLRVFRWSVCSPDRVLNKLVEIVSGMKILSELRVNCPDLVANLRNPAKWFKDFSSVKTLKRVNFDSCNLRCCVSYLVQLLESLPLVIKVELFEIDSTEGDILPLAKFMLTHPNTDILFAPREDYQGAYFSHLQRIQAICLKTKQSEVLDRKLAAFVKDCTSLTEIASLR
mmetsp:Transcript_54556/g.62544  ORF Transcript_54556/g.62544 Transcript_54556/m.62544 type:complete len:395 (+) Transcript_54556:736-1920(+)